MCMSATPPPPPPIPPPPPDFMDEQIALSQTIADQEAKRAFAGLSATINTGAQGVLSPGRTNLNPGGSTQ